MSAFTPGPWKCVGTDAAEGGDWFWISGSNKSIGTVDGSQRDPVQIANANIIAAAPDMYEALKAIAKDYEGTDSPFWANVQAVLAKAEGRTP